MSLSTRLLGTCLAACLAAGAGAAAPALASPVSGPAMPGAGARSQVPGPARVAAAGQRRPTYPKPASAPKPPPKPPAAGRATVAVGAAHRGAGRLPVAVAALTAAPPALVGAAAQADAARAAASLAGASAAPGVLQPVGRVEVTTLDPAAVNRLGGRYIGFQLRRADGAGSGGPVAVRVDVSSVSSAFGGAFASRLRLVRLPACALTDPDAAACHTPTPVPSAADPVGGLVNAVVDAAPAGTGPAAAPVYALASSATAPDSGSFTATPLKASDGWVVGEQAGSFSYSYPLPAAPASGGDTPELELSYDSGSVDGLTSHENNQSSTVGLGWNLDVPYIEHRMAPCTSSDLIGNLCWAGGNFVLSMNGHTSGLDYVATDGDRDSFRMVDDQGWRIEQVYAGASANPNGDNAGVYWKVTATDGTKYYFGRENTAWSTTAGNSTLVVPMYAQNSADVCWDNPGHHCDIAWRWNLAFVVDPVGNLQTYQWSKDRYSYQAPGTGTAHYDGAGYLTAVSYGMTTANATTVAAPQRIDLSYGPRCDFAGCRDAVPHDSYAANYPDTPFDLWCPDTASSCPGGPASPVFFYLRKLNSVTASVASGSGRTPVERVDLDHGWPQYQGQSWSAVMWLRTLKRTGYTPSGEQLSLPEVSFAGDYEPWLPNRWDQSQVGTYQNKPRITDVYPELGGRAHVTYGQPNACDGQQLDGNEDRQTTDCFPSLEDDGHQAWFRRYLVTRLDVIDAYGAPTQTTSYAYDTASGAGWHSDNDPVVPGDKQRWSDYRGYQKVTVSEGTPGGAVTVTEKRFFRGMDGDHLANGSTRSAQVSTAGSSDTATGSLTYRDAWYLKGRPLESRTLRGDGSELDADQHEYAATVITSGPAGPWNLYQNGAVLVNEALTREMTTAGGVPRRWKHTTRNSYDPVYGLLVSSQDDGDPVSGTGPTCTHTTYTRNTDLHIVDTEATEVTAAGSCPAGGTAPTSGVTARTDTYHDANFTSLTAPPTAGLVTKVVRWASAAGTGDPATAVAAARYDGYGRVVATIGPDNFVPGASSFATAGPATTTSYTAPDGPVVGVTVTDPAGQTSSQVLDPGRGRPTSVTDGNNRTTTLAYDALGRLTAVRLPGDGYDSRTFGYTVSDTAPSSVVTSEYPAAGATPIRTWQFIDSLGREFQVQTASSTGTAITTGTRYDDRGNAAVEVAAFGGSGSPGTVYGQWYDAGFAATLPSQTVTTYDDANREITRSLVSAGAVKRTSTTSYDGTSTTTTPPSNAGASQVDLAPTTVVTDLDEHVLTRTQGGQTMRYTYGDTGDLIQVASPLGAVTTYRYDWLGRRTGGTDPDAGATTTDYYPSGVVRHARDAAGGDLFTAIDVLSRPVATHAGTDASGALLSRTVYDGTPLGSLTPLLGTVTTETSYVGSTPGVPGTAYTVAYGYDARYRTSRVDQIMPAAVGAPLAGTYTTTTSYDGLDRPVAVTYPAVGGLPAETVTTGWSGAYPTTLTSPLAGYVTASAFTGIGQLAGRTLGASGATGSVARRYTWDPATEDLLTQAAATPSTATTANLRHDTYTYSPTGDVTKITDGVAGQQQCFTYDALDRLTAAATSAASGATGSGCQADTTGPSPYDERYAYDADANLTALTHNGVTTAFGYGADPGQGLTGGPHAPTTVTRDGQTATYSYDPNGQLATRAAGGVTTGFGWDNQDQLTSVSTGGTTARFTYGPGGARWVRATASETVVYLAGQELHLAADRSDPTAVRYYSIDGHLVAARRTGSAGGSGALSWILADRQDSATVAVDAATGAAVRDRYLPYGGNRDTSPGAGWSMPTDRGWLGQIQDRDTGLDYLGARYYDPLLAHFISTDPYDAQDDPKSANAYGYAAGNPVGASDPDGLWPNWLDEKIKKAKQVIKTYTKVYTRAAARTVVRTVHKVIKTVKKQITVVAKKVAQKVKSVLNAVRKTVGAVVKKVSRAVGTAVERAGTAVKKIGTAVKKAGDTAGRKIGGDPPPRTTKPTPTRSPREQAALDTAVADGRVSRTAPTNHLNGAIAEELGWQAALERGETGIQKPGKVTAVGPDFITYDPGSKMINVWDAKYSVSGKSFPSGDDIPAAKMRAWAPDVTSAVNAYKGPLAAQVQRALASGQVRGRYFKYP